MLVNIWVFGKNVEEFGDLVINVKVVIKKFIYSIVKISIQ